MHQEAQGKELQGRTWPTLVPAESSAACTPIAETLQEMGEMCDIQYLTGTKHVKTPVSRAAECLKG